MVLGNSMLIPVLPNMQTSLGITQFQASLVITLFSVPAGLMIPLAGYLSDRLRRKWIIIPSLGLYALGGLVAAVSAWIGYRVYFWILVGRVLQGIGAAGTAPIAMALVSDLFQGSARSRALGFNEAANGLGKVISPLLGAWVGSWLWYGAFLLFPVLTVPVILGLWFCVREPSAARDTSPADYWKSFVAIWKRDGKGLLAGYLAGATALFLLFGVLFYISEIMESQYHLGVFARGIILAIPLSGMCASSYLTGRWIKKNRTLMKGAVVTGLFAVAATLLALAFLRSFGWQIADLVLSGIGTGTVLPSLNTLITGAASRQERGIITSFYGSVRFLGVAAGPPLFSQWMTLSPLSMFALCAGLAGAAGLLCLLVIRVAEPRGRPYQPGHRSMGNRPRAARIR
ncbi:MAG: MFS transporter [Alicyclobacillaceae bacterium]|nr:MFS transporter [Alicyclobacillaceae bacterium]